MRVHVVSLIAALAVLATRSGLAQEHEHQEPHEHPPEHMISEEAAATAPAGPLEPDTMGAMLSMDPGDRWMTMFHGFVFLTFNRQSGPSGGQDFESQNHLMLAALHRLWGGKLSLLGTFSLEPATIPQAGSYELFQ